MPEPSRSHNPPFKPQDDNKNPYLLGVFYMPLKNKDEMYVTPSLTLHCLEDLCYVCTVMMQS